MAQRSWVSTTLVTVLLLVLVVGAYFYWSLDKELSQLASTHEETLAEARQRQQALTGVQAERDRLQELVNTQAGEQERLRQQLLGARQRLEQRNTSADQLEAELNYTQGNLTDTANQLQGAQQQVADLESRIEALQQELASSQALASDRSEQLSRSEGRVDELEGELETVRAELEQARGQVEQRKAALDEVAAESQSVAEQFRQAREQLALQQARSQNASETIAELEARLQREQSAMSDLQTRLQALSDEKQTLVSRLEDGTTVIKLPEKIVFDSGSARIGESGRQTLQLLANALESFPDHTISVQGHSDSRPISPRLQFRYPTNWELSASRAASAVRVLKETGIAAERMQAVGYADTRPLVEETNDASRRMNRRIEVLLYPDELQVKVDSALNPESPNER